MQKIIKDQSAEFKTIDGKPLTWRDIKETFDRAGVQDDDQIIWIDLSNKAKSIKVWHGTNKSFTVQE